MKDKNLGVDFISIPIEVSGQRLDNFLKTHLQGVPISFIYRIVRKGEIRVNKKRVQPKYKLKDGDLIRIPPVRQTQLKQDQIPTSLNKIANLSNAILYEDDHLLVLNKPYGIAVHSGSTIKYGIIEILWALHPEKKFLELVHRLDRDTSGVLLVAKKRSALLSLHEQLRKNWIQKDYLSLVHGQWESQIKSISVPLLKDLYPSSIGRRLIRVDNNGKFAKTCFKVKENFQIATLVKASPITGRTHQIRVHAQYAGHPIAFDRYYGANEFDYKLQDSGLNRMFLHASSICFDHPSTGKKIRINAPLDQSLNSCLLYLRKNNK